MEISNLIEIIHASSSRYAKLFFAKFRRNSVLSMSVPFLLTIKIYMYYFLQTILHFIIPKVLIFFRLI